MGMQFPLSEKPPLLQKALLVQKDIKLGKSIFFDARKSSECIPTKGTAPRPFFEEMILEGSIFNRWERSCC